MNIWKSKYLLLPAFLLIALAPFLSNAQENLEVLSLPDRAAQIEREAGIKLGTYQEAAEETARKAAEEEKNRQEAAAPKESGIMDWLGSNFFLPFENYVRMPVWNYLKNSGITVKNWISSKIQEFQSDEEGPAVKEPVISIFSILKGLPFTLKSEGYIPFTGERKLRVERMKKIFTPRYEFPLGLSEEGFPVSGSSLVAPLSAEVPLQCRSDIFSSCDTCPRVTDPYKFNELSVIKESCSRCITGNYERLEICKINLKFPVRKPEVPVTPDEKPDDDTAGAVF